MGNPQICLLQLASAGFTLNLLVHFVDHPDATCADGVSETFEPAVGVNRQVAFQGERTICYVRTGLPPWAEPQVLHNDQLGNREAVVDHRHVYFGAGITDAGLVVSRLAGPHRFRKVGEVPVVTQDAKGADGQSQALDQNIIIPQRARDLRSGDDGGGGPVAHAAAVVQAQRPGDHGSVDYLLLVDFTLEMRLGIQGSVVVVFRRNLGQGSFAFVVPNVVLMEITGGGHGKL